MKVAQIILQQLGGNKFIAMTGSRNFMAGENFLSMALAKNKLGASYLKITLTLKDLYLVQFLSRTGEIIKEIDGVYYDQLQKIFTGETGLETSL